MRKGDRPLALAMTKSAERNMQLLLIREYYRLKTREEG